MMVWMDFWRIDFAPLLAACLSALCCCLPGNVLLVRGQSMTTDAISHIVLPGMVAAFLVSGRLSFGFMLGGALLVCLLASLVIEWLGRRQNRDAVLGMVFCTFFAFGILMLELFVDRRVHFDVQHILFGSLESVYWPGLGEGAAPFFAGQILGAAPPALVNLLVLFGFLVALFGIAYKEILALNFDFVHARVHWARPTGATLIYYGLPVVTTMTIVVVFRLVGLILIVGMFIIPPLMASFFTKRMSRRILLSMGLAVWLCCTGYGCAVYGPVLLGHTISLNVGGSIVVLGTFVCLVLMLWKHGIGVKEAR